MFGFTTYFWQTKKGTKNSYHSYRSQKKSEKKYSILSLSTEKKERYDFILYRALTVSAENGADDDHQFDNELDVDTNCACPCRNNFPDICVIR